MIFLTLLTLGAVFTLLTAPPIMTRLSIGSALPGTLPTGTTEAVGKVGEEEVNARTFAQWLTELVPTNPFKAASEGAILPLMIFTICFALAITRLQPERYQLLINFFQAVSDAMLILIGWIFWFAPPWRFRSHIFICCPDRPYCHRCAWLLRLTCMHPYVCFYVSALCDSGALGKGFDPAFRTGGCTRPVCCYQHPFFACFASRTDCGSGAKIETAVGDHRLRPASLCFNFQSQSNNLEHCKITFPGTVL